MVKNSKEEIDFYDRFVEINPRRFFLKEDNRRETNYHRGKRKFIRTFAGFPVFPRAIASKTKRSEESMVKILKNLNLVRGEEDPKQILEELCNTEIYDDYVIGGLLSYNNYLYFINLSKDTSKKSLYGITFEHRAD